MVGGNDGACSMVAGLLQELDYDNITPVHIVSVVDSNALAIKGCQLIVCVAGDVAQLLICNNLLRELGSKLPFLYIISSCLEEHFATQTETHYLLTSECTVSLVGRTIKSTIRSFELNATVAKGARAELVAQNLMNNMCELYLCIDEDGQILRTNDQFLNLMQETKDLVAGRNIWDYYPARLMLDFYSHLYNTMETGVPIAFEHFFPGLDKHLVIRIIKNGGEVSVFMNDVTAQRKLARQVKDDNRKFEQIAWIQSHKVRSPVVTILGLANLLPDCDGAAHENVFIINGIVQAAKELDKITREINDISAADSAATYAGMSKVLQTKATSPGSLSDAKYFQ